MSENPLEFLRGRPLDENGIRMGAIYGLCDPRDGIIRYIGQTTDRRRLYGHVRDARTHQYDTRNMRWIRTLLADGVEPRLIVLEETTKDRIDDQERMWIADFRSAGFDLTNIGPGGQRPIDILNEHPDKADIIKRRSSKLIGHPPWGRKVIPDIQRIYKNLFIGDSCWEWRGALTASGRPVMRLGDTGGKTISVQKFLYELLTGDLLGDRRHTNGCDMPSCARPDHIKILPPLGQAETCHKGHPFTEENTIRISNGGRNCRICHNERGKINKRKARERKRNAASGSNSDSLNAPPQDTVGR